MKIQILFSNKLRLCVQQNFEKVLKKSLINMAKLFQYNFQQYESLSNFIRALLKKNTQNSFFNDFDLKTDLRIEAGSRTAAT